MQTLMERVAFQPISTIQVKPRWQLDPDLVLYLPFWNMPDGTSFLSQDAYGYTFTRTGATSTGQGGWDLDATDDVITATAAATTQLDFTTQQFAVFWWVKPSSTPAISRLVTRATYNDVGWGLYGNTTTIKVSFCPNALDKVLATAIITAGVWQQFVFVRTGTATGTLYKNGLSVGIISTLADITSAAAPFEIGLAQGYAGLPGIWGEVGSYKRILTEHDVLNLFDETKGRYGGG